MNKTAESVNPAKEFAFDNRGMTIREVTEILGTLFGPFQRHFERQFVLASDYCKIHDAPACKEREFTRGLLRRRKH
jgi:hypothetical protein